MDISCVTLEKGVERFIDLIERLLSEKISNREYVCTLRKELVRHLIEVDNWSRTFHVLGMGKPHYTGSQSIELNYTTEPRRYRNLSKTIAYNDEADLLNNPEHCILIGDPGSGKTTTIKRLLQHILLNTPESNHNPYHFPILLILRDCDFLISLCENLAKGIGIRRKDVVIKIVQAKSDNESTIVITENHLFLGESDFGEIPTTDFLEEILNLLNPIIFIDGFDELPANLWSPYAKEIQTLSRKLQVPKIILTCRAGAYTRLFERFSTFEICGLTFDQIRKIAFLWLKDTGHDPDIFCKLLNDAAYSDLSNRPLLLNQLLFIYRNNDHQFPEQPYLIYRKASRLLIKDWDEQRDLLRMSKYARFDTDSKMDFLSEIAYLITYKMKQKQFHDGVLVNCYNRICARYGLPKGEAEEVAQEIETHTGIIVSFSDKYEFSHLSLQEFFCASYLVKDPYSQYISEYISEYPAPVAVAVALASNPTNWFCNIVLTSDNFMSFNINSFTMFLRRILVEKPQFNTDAKLGDAVLKLFFAFYQQAIDIQTDLEYLLDLYGVEESIYISISDYYTINKGKSHLPNYVYLSRNNTRPLSNSSGSFQSGFFPITLLNRVLIRLKKWIYWEDEAGVRHRVVLKDGAFDFLKL